MIFRSFFAHLSTSENQEIDITCHIHGGKILRRFEPSKYVSCPRFSADNFINIGRRPYLCTVTTLMCFHSKTTEEECIWYVFFNMRTPGYQNGKITIER